MHTPYYIQGRHGEFEPGKVQYSTQNFFDRLFLIRATQNLGKDQTLPALPAVASLYSKPAMPQFAMRNKTSNNFQEKDVPILLKKCTKTQNFEVLKYVHSIYILDSSLNFLGSNST